MTRKSFRKTAKPVDEQSVAERLARGAIARLTLTLNTGRNCYGTYGDNVRASIKRHEQAIAELTKET